MSSNVKLNDTDVRQIVYTHQRYGTLPAMASRPYLPHDTGERTPARMAGTRLTYPGGM